MSGDSSVCNILRAGRPSANSGRCRNAGAGGYNDCLDSYCSATHASRVNRHAG